MSSAATRRQFLEQALATATLLLSGCSDGGADGSEAGPPDALGCPDALAGWQRRENLLFLDEGNLPLEQPYGQGWDKRLLTDLSKLDPDHLLTDNDRFYVRTSYPDRLDPNAPWKISLGGLVRLPQEVTLEELLPQARPLGTHLMECSGNGAGGHFGLLSAATWTGAPVLEVLRRVERLASATRVLISGFDDHSQASMTSVPGASWIFTLDQLAERGAFLATEMNGARLPPDHGYPVRLLVPGWYGCTCIKWVNEIKLVDDSELATAQMKEFAARTHQDGVPELARDYKPALIDQDAMPVRVEQWTLGDRTRYRVAGILWGGERPTDKLVIRFNPQEDYVPVVVCPKQTTNQSWTFWSHVWTPASAGIYRIQLQVDDSTVPKKRLDAGYYIRSVQVAAV